jgi:DNA-binding CsgD family transcriptional regulator
MRRRNLSKAAVSVETIGDTTVTRDVMAPGWRWSVDMQPVVQTDLCRAFHQICIFSGHLRVRLEDGMELDLHAGDVAAIPPGHDAWVVGDEPCSAADFSQDYAQLIDAGEVFNSLTNRDGSRRPVSRADAARRMRADARSGRLDPHAVELVLGAVGPSARRRQGPARLSQRETEVLVLIATGASARQVGLILGIQEKTARNHIEHIYAKCDVSTRSDATRFAIAHGLVEPLATAASRLD